MPLGLVPLLFHFGGSRFKDEDMPRFLEYMRNPGAGRMPADLRAFLREWEVLDPKPGAGERNKVREWRERCERGSERRGARVGVGPEGIRLGALASTPVEENEHGCLRRPGD